QSGQLKIAVHAGGNPDWNRRWPLAKFAQLCQLLSRHADAEIELVGGKNEELENRFIIDFVRKDYVSAQIHDLSACTVGEMVDHIAASDLFIGNDSGPMNIAVALGAPVVVIRGADAENFRPDGIDKCHVVLSNWTQCSRYLNGSNVC